MTDIKEKVLKKIRDRVREGGNREPTSITLGVADPVIDLTLAEVGKVIDDFPECGSYVKKKLKQKLGINSTPTCKNCGHEHIYRQFCPKKNCPCKEFQEEQE